MFKISICACSIAFAALAIAPAYAEPTNQSQSVESNNISPRELVSLARHGGLKAQGIPSQNNFRQGIRTGKITAQKLVDSAISANRLPETTIKDSNYLNTVNNHLKSGGCGS